MSYHYSDLTIVGFNGTAQGACGYAVAVARHGPTGKFIRLSFPEEELELIEGRRRDATPQPPPPREYTPRGHAHAHDAITVEAFHAQERLTLFAPGVEFPAFHNAVVLYVAEPLLNAVRLDTSAGPADEELDWKPLSEDPHGVWVTCAGLDSAFRMMNFWGVRLKRECVESLSNYFAAVDNDRLSAADSLLEEAEAAAELGYAAARDDVLREDILLLHGVALTFSTNPREVDDLFEMDILPEFPDWTRETFDRQLKHLIATLRVRAQSRLPLPRVRRSVEYADPKVSARTGQVMAGAAAPQRAVAAREHDELDVLLESVESNAREVQKGGDQSARVSKAVIIAERCRRRFIPRDTDIAEVVAELNQTKFGDIRLDSAAKLKVCASDPFFYLLPYTADLTSRRRFDFSKYVEMAMNDPLTYSQMCQKSPLIDYTLRFIEEIQGESHTGELELTAHGR